jgi:cationic peptide transport system ATP-binding protein
MNLLDIRNLSIELLSANNSILAVDRVSLTIKEGEVRGLVGESGSGKSLLAQAIVGVLDDRWRVDADRFHWRGIDLMRLSVEERKAVISKDVAMIFQEPMACLDPTTTIGEQLEEAVDSKQLSGYFWQRRKQRKLAAANLLHKVGIKNHELCTTSYPHQLTEALCQRVMIAMALAKRPLLLIADEPTAAMESTNQGQIFRLLASLNQLKNMSILLISHDLENVTHWTNTITVMYSGQFVEAGTTKHIFDQPFHPYTRALVDSSPKANSQIPVKSRLMTLPGSIPILQHLPIGCRLGPRCPRAQKACVQAPKVKNYHGHQVSCHYSLKDSY